MSLELKGIRKAFRTNVAVDDVSLDVADGEIVVVFGPSGTGKTVLLRIAAGIHDVDAGQVLIDGRDVTTESPDARGLGMAFQNFALFPHMTAFDNVASALRARKATRTEIAEKVEAVGRLLKIDHVLSHYPRELSNGQKQRTALARALVAEREAMLKNTRVTLNRASELLKTPAGSQKTFDDAQAADRQAEAQLNSAREALRLQEAGFRQEDIALGKAQLGERQAAVTVAERNLADADLIAPNAGTILSRVRGVLVPS